METLPKQIDDILDIYVEVCKPGVHPSRWRINGLRILEDLKKALWVPRSAEYRLGSEFSGHTKLQVTLRQGMLEFTVNPNIDRDDPSYKKALKMMDAFTSRVNDYVKNGSQSK